MGDIVLQWLAPVPHTKRIPCSNTLIGTILCGSLFFFVKRTPSVSSSLIPRADKQKTNNPVIAGRVVVFMHVLH